ncbi:MAG: GtrA family protein [Haloarculaceae archaeon]
MTDGRLAALRSRVRFGKFVSVGAVGAAFDVATLLALTELGHVSPAIANVFSIEVAILVMFAVNERWTFADHGADGARSLGGRLLRSHLVRAAGSTIQYLLFVAIFYNVAVTLSVFGVNLWLVAVKGASIALAMFVNYVFESLFTWRVHDEAA